MYEKITTTSTQLSSGETAPDELDRVLSMCIYYQLPVYISIPSDVVMMKCDRPGAFPFPVYAPSDPYAPDEAINETLDMLDKAQKPVVIGGVELIRFHGFS